MTQYTRESIIKFISDNLDRMSPSEVDNYAIRTAILADTIGDDLARAERAYADERKKIMLVCKSVAAAEANAEATDQFEKMKKKKYLYETSIEIINALKNKARTLQAQYRNTPHGEPND